MLETSTRLLSLLSLLQVRRDWPGALLAERLEVSPRTVRRDVDRLRDLGYPVRALKGPDGGYRLEPGSELPPLLFDDEQAVAVAVALQTAATSLVGIEEAAARALATVRQVMPARLRHRVDSVRVTAVPPTGARAAPPLDTAVVVALSSAVRAREVLRFGYAAAAGRGAEHAAEHGWAPTRRVEPHHLVTWAGRWYLVAWDLDRGDWRTFRADRITPHSPTGPRFAPRALPGDDLTAFVTGHLQRYDHPDAWPCRGEVILNVAAADIAGWVRHGIVEELGPTRSRLVIGAWSWIGLAATIGTFDAAIEVVSPPELKEACAALSRRYAAAADVPAARPAIR